MDLQVGAQTIAVAKFYYRRRQQINQLKLIEVLRRLGVDKICDSRSDDSEQSRERFRFTESHAQAQLENSDPFDHVMLRILKYTPTH